MGHRVSEVDIFRSAMVLVKAHGEKAKYEAAMLALSQDLELEGLAVWSRIISAIEDIQEKNNRCIN